MAGRLHKPVNILEETVDPILKKALSVNLRSALNVALLLLPEKFAEEELYHTIASLSYRGDFRMTVGEDKNKVGNIVRPQLERFRELYSNSLQEAAPLVHRSLNNNNWEQDMSLQGRKMLLSKLPIGLSSKLGQKHTSFEVDKAVAAIVRTGDKTQALKGILTAGPLKALLYSSTKLKKMVKSMRIKV